MKVLYITNIPSPYKVDYYNELGKYCELTALFEAETSTERSEEWKKYRFETFDGIILKGKRVSVDTAFCPEIVKYLQKGRYDIVVLTVLASPTALLAVHTLRRRKSRTTTREMVDSPKKHPVSKRPSSAISSALPGNASAVPTSSTGTVSPTAQSRKISSDIPSPL